MSRFFKPYEGGKPFLFISYPHKNSAEVLDTTPVVEEQQAEPVKKAAKKTAQKAAQQLEKTATETATQATSATVDQVKSTQQQQPKTAPIKRNR